LSRNAIPPRALAVWCGLLVLAFVNGTLREVALMPSLGEAPAHAVSSVTLSAAILVLAWSTIRWVHPVTAADAWRIGALWLAMTLAFEFLAGHYVFGNTWATLWADYDVLHGRLWIVVLITTFVAPVVAAASARQRI
jgi:hypothetical protein